MAYPNTVDELTDGVPADGIAATTPLGSGTYPHDDHHRALGVAVEAIETQLVGAYTAYTPTLTASVTPPTLGLGSSAVGYYKRVGHWVDGYAVITFGSSGVAAGSGYYGLSLPVVPVNRIQPMRGVGFAYDDSDQYRFVAAAASVIPVLWAAATSNLVLLQSNVAGQGFANGYNPIGAAVPFTWQANDQLAVPFSYEAAAAS